MNCLSTSTTGASNYDKPTQKQTRLASASLLANAVTSNAKSEVVVVVIVLPSSLKLAILLTSGFFSPTSLSSISIWAVSKKFFGTKLTSLSKLATHQMWPVTCSICSIARVRVSRTLYEQCTLTTSQGSGLTHLLFVVCRWRVFFVFFVLKCE